MWGGKEGNRHMSVCRRQTERNGGQILQMKHKSLCSPLCTDKASVTRQETNRMSSSTYSLTHALPHSCLHTLPLDLASAPLRLSNTLYLKWFSVFAHSKFFSRHYLLWLLEPLGFDRAWPVYHPCRGLSPSRGSAHSLLDKKVWPKKKP